MITLTFVFIQDNINQRIFETAVQIEYKSIYSICCSSFLFFIVIFGHVHELRRTRCREDLLIAKDKRVHLMWSKFGGGGVDSILQFWRELLDPSGRSWTGKKKKQKRNALQFCGTATKLRASAAAFHSAWKIGRAAAHILPREMRRISRTRQCRSVTQSSNQRLIGWRERPRVSELKLWHLEPTRKWTTLLRFMKTIQIENPIYQPPLLIPPKKANWIKWCFIRANYGVHIGSFREREKKKKSDWCRMKEAANTKRCNLTKWKNGSALSRSPFVGGVIWWEYKRRSERTTEGSRHCSSLSQQSLLGKKIKPALVASTQERRGVIEPLLTAHWESLAF